MTKKKGAQNSELLYEYLFHYNPYMGEWHAFTRDNLLKYFGSNPKESNYLVGKTVDEIKKQIIGGK